MSLILNGPYTEREIAVKTLTSHAVLFGGVVIGMRDFLAAAHYALTNTYLDGDDDPRIAFVAAVRALRTTRERYSGGRGGDTHITNGCDSINSGYLFERFRAASLDAIGSADAAPVPAPLRRAARRRTSAPAKRRTSRTR